MKPVADKLLRIESLQPHMANGLILLRPEHRVLLEQLRHFPHADHDDGPDALQMVWAGALANAAPIEWHSTADDVSTMRTSAANGRADFRRPATL